MNKLTLNKGSLLVSLAALFLLLVQACKKEILLPKNGDGAVSSKLKTISYQNFIGAIDTKGNRQFRKHTYRQERALNEPEPCLQ